MKNNVGGLEKKFCNMCGTCISICPVGALSVKDNRIVADEEKCIECGMCKKVCQGIFIDRNKIEEKIFLDKKDDKIGVFRSVFLAKSNNKDIRSKTSSGGFITSLLLELMDKKVINKAVVVEMNGSKIWAKIAKTKKEIKECAQSKYSIVTLNHLLKEVDEKTAIVGLPCHIDGLRKYQSLKKIKTGPVIGLFCGFNLEFEATKYLVSKLGVKEKDIKSIEYRGGEWPGGFLVKTKQGEEKFIPKEGYNFIFPLFIPDRCLTCTNLTSELADISVGDYWLEKGWSSVIVRSKKGEEIFNLLKNIDKKKISEKEIHKSHEHLFRYKKRGAYLRMKMMNAKTSPYKEIKFNLRDYISYIIFMTIRSPLVSFIVKKMPLRLLIFASRFAKKAI